MNMNFSEVSFQRRFAKLESECPGKNLAEYYGIKSNKDKSTDIIFDKENGTTLEIQINQKIIKNKELAEFIKKTYIGLPIELNEIIAKHILEEYYLNIVIIQEIEIDFPYKRPKMKFKGYKSNLQYDFKKEITEICKNHNKKHWELAVLIDKDILDFYVDMKPIEYYI